MKTTTSLFYKQVENQEEGEAAAGLEMRLGKDGSAEEEKQQRMKTTGEAVVAEFSATEMGRRSPQHAGQKKEPSMMPSKGMTGGRGWEVTYPPTGE